LVGRTGKIEKDCGTLVIVGVNEQEGIDEIKVFGLERRAGANGEGIDAH
jgi:hypothetical protein